MYHAKALGTCEAYDMYMEVAEGDLKEEWQVAKPVDYQMWREVLSETMLHYNPRQRKYLGDDEFRLSTQQNRKQRA
jgi:hypothetical protein